MNLQKQTHKCEKNMKRKCTRFHTISMYFFYLEYYTSFSQCREGLITYTRLSLLNPIFVCHTEHYIHLKQIKPTAKNAT